MIRTTSLMITAAALALSLSACQTTTRSAMKGSLDPTALQARENAGAAAAPLAALESKYKADSANPQAATEYAHALREAGRLDRAALVLEAAANNEKAPHFDAKLEYATIQAALGNYANAEDYARQAVMLAPESGPAYHILGVALDAQGHHDQAEVAFRRALEHWQGDSVPVLNNLGLNLAAQGFIDEALETLRKAQALSPDREEIERNIRIVSALQYTPPKEGSRLVPMPSRKPAPGEATPLSVKEEKEEDDSNEIMPDRED